MRGSRREQAAVLALTSRARGQWHLLSATDRGNRERARGRRGALVRLRNAGAPATGTAPPKASRPHLPPTRLTVVGHLRSLIRRHKLEVMARRRYRTHEVAVESG
jgi:hypothetical protein